MLTLIPDIDPRLRQKCEFVNLNKPGFDIDQLVSDMFHIMHANNGVGLAAPQVGVMKRLFIMAIPINGVAKHMVCINPMVVTARRPEIDTEGCLSFPGIKRDVSRARMIKGNYRDQSGRPRSETFEGVAARCFLHELDHLNGVVFLDR